jgi:malate permease and related proteins
MENFILIALFVLLGMVFRRLSAFPKETPQVLNMFALYVSLPAVILLTVPRMTFSREALTPALVAWGMLAFSAVAVLLAARIGNWSRSITGVLLLVVPIGNTSFMGVPMVQAFFGEAGIPYLIVYDQFGTIAIFATYGSLILALYGREGSVNLAGIARRALLFPPTMALVAGLALRSWPYPSQMSTILTGIATTLTPLVMTAIGFQMNWRLRPTVLAPLGFGLAVKLVVAPVVALIACRLAGLHGLPVDVSIFEAGMPPMVTAGALAVAAGMEPELAVALVGLGLILSFATLPLLYLLL